MYRLISTGFVACALALAFSGCGKQTAPELQTTTGVQPLQQPTAVTGCLKSGIADNTFILTVIGPGADTATYHLVARADQNLRDHVGEQVEVSGTLKAREEIQSTSGETAQKPAKGVNETPVVETKTELDIRQLSVDSLKPTGNRCDK